MLNTIYISVIFSKSSFWIASAHILCKSGVKRTRFYILTNRPLVLILSFLSGSCFCPFPAPRRPDPEFGHPGTCVLLERLHRSEWSRHSSPRCSSQQTSFPQRPVFHCSFVSILFVIESWKQNHLKKYTVDHSYTFLLFC